MDLLFTEEARNMWEKQEKIWNEEKEQQNNDFVNRIAQMEEQLQAGGIKLTEAKDKTTFLHESAHVFLEVFAALEDTNPEIAAEMAPKVKSSVCLTPRKSG